MNDDTRRLTDYEYHLYEELRAGRVSRREFLQRATVMGVSATTIGTIVAACGGSSHTTPAAASPTTTAAAGTPRRGGTVRLAGPTLGGPIDPIEEYGAGAADVVRPALDALAQVSPDFSIHPQLASSWKPVTPKEWHFTIRSGVTFHDGTPLTADDVVSTFELALGPNSSGLSAFETVLSSGHVEKVNSTTVAFHLERPYVDFPYLTCPPSGENLGILPKGYKIGSFTNGHIGSGPFILTNYVARQSATYVRNPNYWDKPKPYLDGWRVTFYEDNPPMLLALQAGNVDIVPAIPYTETIPLKSNPNLKIVKQPHSAYRELHMRTDRHPWTDPRVRQALAYTIDRSGAIAGLFGGNASLGNDHGFAPVFNTAPAAGEVPQRAQDIAKAKSLLAQAGHPNGFSATLTSEQYLEIPSYLTLVKADAAKAGINITLNIEPQNTYYGSGNNQPWLDVTLGCVDWAGRAIAGQLIDSAYTCHGVWNSAHWCDPQFTHLMSQYDGELDLQKRKQLALQAAKIQNEATPAIISYWITVLNGVNSKIQGYNGIGTDTVFDTASIWLSA
jgi:peptide/nickel transport system substrate-binding protein